MTKTPCDLCHEAERLRQENVRLLSELSRAHRDIVPWIEKASRLKADLDMAQDALRRMRPDGRTE